MMLQLKLLGGGLLLVMLMMLALWAVQRRTRNAGIVDIGWAFGIGMLAIGFAFFAEGLLERRALVAVLAAAWSFRLGFYLVRRVGSEAEDGRYQTLRAMYSNDRELQFFFLWFFQFQALLVVLFAVPPLIAMSNPTAALTFWDLLGVAVWLLAVTGESVADRQLARFRARPENRGQVCRDGLWRYSRHPNYFFEWVHWWAYCLLAIGAPLAWVTLLGPLLMLFFLYRVTGIPKTEEQALKSRGEAYREYQRTTSAFFPWFPKGQST